MTIRVGLIGCGAVGSIHAANLRRDGVELTAVYSPSSEEASSFASTHGIQSFSQNLAEAIAKVDVAIICSPSDLHFEQARTCVEAGVHTLVELPPCAEVSEAEELGESARKRGVHLGCAHTSRYLYPYARLKLSLQKEAIGEVLQVNYVRFHQLRPRSWMDNALLHHAAHPIDLLIDWFGGLEPVACLAVPHVSAAQSATVLGKLPSGGPVAITVSYASRFPLNHMLLVGRKHTVETDGFSYVSSDLAELEFHGTGNQVYEEAIRDQDVAFLGACLGEDSFVDWADTVKLMRTVNQFQALGNEGKA